MKLRAQLVVAFLLLSVLPLAGVTLYSYRSSLRAFRAAVEAEAEQLTRDMGGRMEIVTADLGRRIQRLDRLPYHALLDPEAQSAVVDAGPFLSGLRDEMGDAAPFIQTLEYVPVAPPSPPLPPGAEDAVPQPPESERVVIHLGGLVSGSTWEEAARQTAHLLKTGEDVVVIPDRWVAERFPDEAERALEAMGRWLATADIDDEAAEVGLRIAEAAGEQSAAMAEELRQLAEQQPDGPQELDEMRRRLAETLAGIAQRVAEAREEKRSAQRQVEVRTTVVARGAEPREAPSRRPAAPRIRLEREFKCSVREGGEQVGEVKARINADEVLHAVLSQTRTDKGEIAFAVGANGAVYTPDSEDQQRLESLGIGARLGDTHGGSRVEDNWLVVTREMPELGLEFGIARPVGESLQEIRRTAGRNMGWGLALVAVAMLGIIPLSGRMTHNLSRLSAGVSELARGNLDVRVPVRSRDEFGELATAFNRMGEDLRRNQRQLLAQARLRKELEMCRQIQSELLPSGRSSLDFAEVRAVSIPAREVGGDFFNYFTLPEGDVALLMGDVSGKGVPAALMMANLQATLRARLPLERDLAKLATELDAEIERSTPVETYVTLFMGVIDAERRTLRYVNAGHNSQYVLHAVGEVVCLASGGRPLGLLSGGGFVEGRVQLGAGDMLFLFTDGLVEAENEQGEPFGEQRLERLLLRERRSGADGLLATVEEHVQKHRGTIEAADDASILVLALDDGSLSRAGEA